MLGEILAGLEYVCLECILCNCPSSAYILSAWLLSFNRMKQHKFRRLVVFTSSQFAPQISPS